MNSQSTNVRTKSVRATLVALLVALSFPALGNAQNFYLDRTTNIAWSGAFNSVTDIQGAFNNARTIENGENLGAGQVQMPMMTMPSQAEWDGKSNSLKALWLINSERVARNLLPLQDVDLNVITVAQNYANFLLTNNAWGHEANGQTPGQRLDANPAILGHHDNLGISENLSAFVTSGNSIPLPVERSVYGWNYDDLSSAWGHRHALLWTAFTNNFGDGGSEGLMGIGRASGGPWSGFGTPWNFAEIIVFNVFDPNASYNAALPVQLSSFSGSVTAQRHVLLKWRTLSEINNYGFFVQRRTESVEPWSEVPNSFVAGHGTTNMPHDYTFTDAGVSAGDWQYRLRQVDLDGAIHFSEPIQVNLVTGVVEATAPSEFSLHQNYPNPFNPSTVIRYALPVDARVTLEVYDMLGRQVAVLVDAQTTAGYHDVSFDATNLASGFYTYRLHSDAGDKNNLVLARKLMVLK
ncbi:MAG: T9SS type A sorting domain-containing protein [Ignavibacteriae bacterium]|nr:T9SS type A sorting domain-containing protein [Ignavibacteriota bacterium]